MDIATIGGFVLGLTAVGVAFLLEGGQPSAIFQLPAMLLVIGGTLGASMVSTSFDTFKSIPRLLRIAFRSHPRDPNRIIDHLVHLAEHARREGVLGLEKDLAQINDLFMHKSIQLVIDGTEVTQLTAILQNEIANIEERHHNGVALFSKMGGFSPTLGIIGTVLGLIHTLSNTDDASRMATSIAGAFIATLWGVALANLLFLPIADKLRFRHTEEMSTLQLIMEGAVAIQSGENPRIIRDKLMAFLRPQEREVKTAARV